MKLKEQSINQWDFKDIFMTISCLTGTMAIYIGISQYFSFDITNKLLYLSLGHIIFYSFSIVLIFYFAIFKKSNSIKNFLGINQYPLLIRQGVIVFLIMIIVTSLIDVLFNKFAGIKASDVYEKLDKNILFLISMVGLIFAPLAEELFFRGFLQPVFVRKFGLYFGIILVSLSFSILHFLYIENISALLSIISVGLILSIAKEKTKSLIPCIIAHFLNNIAAVIYINFP